ncbi:MAG TPA: TcfC E-set like domain-containing protein [Sphingomonas sp.]|nr:TcfC E-set like domain-containing protein [Sphingomonas sp.]
MSAPAIAAPNAPKRTPAAPSQQSEDHVIIASGQTLETTPPPGFEGLTAPVDTLFDTYYLGRRIGAFRAALANGKLTYSNPEEVAAALNGLVSHEAALRVLSHPLDLNEKYRCFPGQTTNCGLLPPGQEGAIVDSEHFSVELFFAPADVVRAPASAYHPLGPSISGPSLIQNVAFSVASSSGPGGGVQFGGTFDTAASFGQTAFIAQTLVDGDQGARVNDAFVQHVWTDRIARAGLFEDLSTRLLTSYRLVGGEFGSFYPSSAYGGSIATPIQIVLPRDADVELRRQGVLVSVQHYQAGLQLIDTSSLPEGSYPVTIIARAQGSVILQEVRSFTKAAGLPLPGKTEFSVRAGFYAQDRFDIGLDQDNIDQPFFPRIGGKPVIGGRIARRIGKATGVELNLLSIDGKEYAEASLTTFRGNLQGFITVAAGTDGSYGALVTGMTSIHDVRLSATLRRIHSTNNDFDLADFRQGKYRAFVRSESSVLGSVDFPIWGGSASLSGSYTRSPGLPDQYSASVRYTKAIVIAHHNTLLTAFAASSTNDTRIGFTLSLNFGLDSRTTASVTGGAEVVPDSSGGTREGFSPILNATVSRRDRLLGADVVNQAGVSTDADSDRAFVSSDVASSLGQLDVTAQYQRTRNSGDLGSIFANGQTGFAIGGGLVKLGLAQPGQAVILSDIGQADSIDDQAPANSGYRVRVDNQSADLIRPGHVSAVGVAPYEEYDVELEPENAPPYEIDIKSHKVTMYPGNVVRLHYEATHSFSLFGQLVDGNGLPIRNARIKAGDDITVTGDQGYFTITAPGTAALEILLSNGGTCQAPTVKELIGAHPSIRLNRIGQLVCHPQAATGATEK